ncbi:MAG: PAS domain-containing protein [Anaerolineaceae bacterium]
MYNEMDWIHEFPGAITVCDKQGIILQMNARACEVFRDDGGAALIGKNILDCHPSPAREKVQELLTSGGKNAYTIEKKGVQKLIYQSPWYKDGEYAGMVELSLEIPVNMPHFIRK